MIAELTESLNPSANGILLYTDSGLDGRHCVTDGFLCPTLESEMGVANSIGNFFVAAGRYLGSNT